MIIRALVPVGVAALLAGCAADGAPPASTVNFGQTTVPGAPVIRIDARNFSYSVSIIRAAPGEQLTIEMTSQDERHDLVLDDGATRLRIVHASDGVTAVGGLTAPFTPGTYVLYCSEIGHRGEGMVAELVVA